MGWFTSMIDGFRFFLIWIYKPRQLGAVLPSSRKLAASMARRVDVEKPGVVIDLGAGTGRMTEAILNAGVAPENLVVVERESQLCKVIEQRYPQVRVLCADAGDLVSLLRDMGVSQVSTIVSSLPFLAIKNEDCRRILDAAMNVLPDDGEIVQFTYGPGSPIPEDIRDELRIQGRRTHWIVANIPPAAVWSFRRKGADARERAAA